MDHFGLSPGPCPLLWARSGRSVGDTENDKDGENDGLLDDGLLALDGLGLALRDGLLNGATSFGSAGRSSSELSVSASLPLAAASTPRYPPPEEEGAPGEHQEVAELLLQVLGLLRVGVAVGAAPHGLSSRANQ